MVLGNVHGEQVVGGRAVGIGGSGACSCKEKPGFLLTMNGELVLGTEEVEIAVVSFFNAICVTLPLCGLPNLPWLGAGTLPQHELRSKKPCRLPRKATESRMCSLI